MCKYVLALIFLVSFNFIVRGQNFFDSVPITEGQANQSRLFDVYPDSNFIYIIGDLMDTTIDPLSPQVRPWWGAFNYAGELVKKNIIHSDSISGDIDVSGSRILKDNNNKLFYFCQLFDTSGISKGILLKIDANSGEFEDSKIFSNPIDSFEYFISNWFEFENKNSENLVLSGTININNIPRTCITKIDSNFNTTQNIIIDDNGRNNFIFYFEMDTDSTFIIIGESYKRGDTSSSPSVRPYYMRINDNGEILTFNLAAGISDKSVLFSTADAFTVKKDNQNNWIFGAVSYFRNGGGPDGWYTYPYVYSYNEDFSTLNWKRNFSENVNDIKQKNILYSADYDNINHQYIVEGIDINKDETNSYIFKIRDTGDSIWTRHFIPLGWKQDSVAWALLRDIKKSHHNSYVSVGCVSDRPAFLWRSWIINIDTFGCIIPGCQLSVNDLAVESVEIRPFTIFPNPTSSILGLLCHKAFSDLHISLFDLNGRLVEKTQFDALIGYQYIFDVSQLSKGLYIIKIEELNGTLLQTENIIVD